MGRVELTGALALALGESPKQVLVVAAEDVGFGVGDPEAVAAALEILINIGNLIEVLGEKPSLPTPT